MKTSKFKSHQCGERCHECEPATRGISTAHCVICLMLEGYSEDYIHYLLYQMTNDALPRNKCLRMYDVRVNKGGI